MRHLQYPPSLEFLPLLAHRDLYPTYRDAFDEKFLMSIEDLQSWGLQYKHLQKQNKRWSAPLSTDKMHIAYAAPRKSLTKKTAAEKA